MFSGAWLEVVGDNAEVASGGHANDYHGNPNDMRRNLLRTLGAPVATQCVTYTHGYAVPVINQSGAGQTDEVGDHHADKNHILQSRHAVNLVKLREPQEGQHDEADAGAEEAAV